jgi:hypothetical protein
MMIWMIYWKGPDPDLVLEDWRTSMMLLLMIPGLRYALKSLPGPLRSCMISTTQLHSLLLMSFGPGLPSVLPEAFFVSLLSLVVIVCPAGLATHQRLSPALPPNKY